ncbi:hypothetical protein [Arthrobacter sp. D1-17]
MSSSPVATRERLPAYHERESVASADAGMRGQRWGQVVVFEAVVALPAHMYNR